MERKFKRVLITGIAGAGGSFLAEHILKKEKNIEVFGLYRSVGFIKILKKKFKKKIVFLKVDLNNYKKVFKILKKIKPDLIIHLASDARPRESFDEPIKVITNNNNITLNLLESVRSNKIDPLILICSTSEVYGKVGKEEFPITEKQILRPVNPYSVSKSFQDLVAQMYHESYKLKIIITRMFSYINPRGKFLFQSVFAKQVVEIEKGKKRFLEHGNLNSIRNFIDLKDAMEAYWYTAKRGRIGEIYNIGGKKVMSVRKFLSELKKRSNKKIESKLNKKLLRPSDVSYQISDSSKFYKHIRWEPKVTFNESIKKLLEYFRKDKK